MTFETDSQLAVKVIDALEARLIVAGVTIDVADKKSKRAA